MRLPLILPLVLALAAPAQARPPRPAASEGPGLPWSLDDPGRLLNVAQQHLARHDIDSALLALHRAIEGRPGEGFAHTILAEAQTFGLDQGPEAVAAYRALADEHLDQPELRIWAVRAEVALHRADKFTSASTPWVQSARATLDSLADEARPASLRYHALLARRDLRYRYKDNRGALGDGVAAWRLDPGPLQGRISALLDARTRGALDEGVELCLGIIESDPWAVEACATLWTTWKELPDAEVKAAQQRVLDRVAALEEPASRDAAVANEVVKFYQRIKDHNARRLFEDRTRRALGEFRSVDQKNWWKGGLRIDPEHAVLFRETNKTARIEDPAEKLKALLTIEEQSPLGATHIAARRYRWALLRAAKATEPVDQQRWLASAEELTSVHAEDPAAWRELALAREQGSDLDGALAAVRREQQARRAVTWVPQERRGAVPFRAWVVRQRRALGAARSVEARLLEALDRADEAYAVLTEAAWLSDDGQDWLRLGANAAERGDRILAREADLEGLSRLDKVTIAALPAEARAVMSERFATANPQLATVSDPDTWKTLVAAAWARREERLRGEDQGSSERRKEQHPLVGQAAPELKVSDLQGAQVDLAELSGRVVVVDFWATWCAPCRKELPEIEAARRRLDGQPVTWLALSTDQDPAAIAPFLSDKDYGFSIVHEGSAALQKRWRVKGIPSLFVIGPDGVIRNHHQGYRKGVGQQVEDEIRRLLR